MSGELVAWQVGVDLARQNLSVVKFLTSSAARQISRLSETAQAARSALAGDVWSFWVRQGYTDTLAALDA